MYSLTSYRKDVLSVLEPHSCSVSALITIQSTLLYLSWSPLLLERRTDMHLTIFSGLLIVSLESSHETQVSFPFKKKKDERK